MITHGYAPAGSELLPVPQGIFECLGLNCADEETTEAEQSG